MNEKFVTQKLLIVRVESIKICISSGKCLFEDCNTTAKNVLKSDTKK